MTDAAPNLIRQVFDFRNVSIYETDANLYPIGAVTRETYYPYIVSGNTISGSTTTVPVGTPVSGSNGYYGLSFTGNKVLTITDPIPQIFSFPGDDQVQSVITLPSIEPISGELTLNITHDLFDALAQNVKPVQVGQINLIGQQSNQRINELPLCVLAYSYAQDDDTDDSAFGDTQWNFRIYPSAQIHQRDNGAGVDMETRLYTLIPDVCSKYPWGTAYSTTVEGYTKNRLVRGNAQYKPMLVGYRGNGSTRAFPFDSRYPAESGTKIAGVWKNGAEISSSATKSTRGVVLSSAPSSGDAVIVLYETLK